MAEPIQIKAKITNSYALTEDILRLTILAPDIAQQAMPGQFVMVRTANEHDPLLRRPFSIHDVNPDGTFQLLFKIIGKGTRLLAGKKSNEEIDLVGPLGRGFAVVPQKKHILLGGGMGIAPLLFLARYITTKMPDANLLVLLGARSANEIGPLADEFRQVSKSVSFATDNGSVGYHGFVTDLFEQGLATGKIGKGCMVYSCGPHPMLTKAVAICKKADLQCQVSLETMMACGISACLGCAIKKRHTGNEITGRTYLHVCKHGPVFDAGEVAWE